MKKLFLWFFSFLALSAEGNYALDKAQSLYQEGNRYFAEKNYIEAIQKYHMALEIAPSAEVHFNLGSAYQQLNKPGYAFYNYIVAHQYKPLNTHYAKTLKSLKETFPQLPNYEESFYQKIWYCFHVNTWTIFLFIFFWGGCLFFLIFLFQKEKKYYLKIAIQSFFCAGIIVLLWALNYNSTNKAILVQRQDLRLAPTEKSPTKKTIPEGTLCLVKQQQGNFFYVDIEGIDDGWIEQDYLMRLKR